MADLAKPGRREVVLFVERTHQLLGSVMDGAAQL